MACTVMAYTVMVNIVMAYTVMAYTVMAYTVMAHAMALASTYVIGTNILDTCIYQNFPGCRRRGEQARHRAATAQAQEAAADRWRWVDPPTPPWV